MRYLKLCTVIAGVLAAGPGPAYALRVAWNVDVHQNKFDDYANDFHIWGVLESGDEFGNNPPTFVKQVNFYSPAGGTPFDTFNSSIQTNVSPGTLPPGAPGPPVQPPFYYFAADWTDSTGNVKVGNCTWVHFGLEFDETCYNIGYWLQGTWTRDGVDPGTSPIYGFEVDDLAATQTFTLQNASDVETCLEQMDLLVLPPGTDFPLENLNQEYFDTHSYPWQSVHLPSPVTMAGNGSEYVVDIESVLGRRLGYSEILISRQHSTYTGSDPEDFWQFELHEAHVPEPLTMLGVFTGLAGVGAYLRRRRTARVNEQ